MSFRNLLLSILVLFFMFGCSKDNSTNPTNQNSPIIANINPTSGKIADFITITGSKFGANRATSFVNFNGTNATEYTSWSDTEIKVKVPNNATSGKVSVTVNGTKSNEVDFTLTFTNPTVIETISPSSAKIGDIITITGTNFGSSHGSSFVSFAGTQATEYTSWSDTEIKVKVPNNSTSGKVSVTVNGTKSNEVDFTVTITISTFIEIVLIPAGTFQMGNTGAYTGYDSEKPVHSVTLTKSFYMGKYEITQAQWKAIMGTDPSYFKGDNLPVENVSWYDAVDFCNKLSVKNGLSSCYTIKGLVITCNWTANGWRLPTEAEWEYSCKAGTTTDFNNGNLTNELCSQIDANLDKIGWYCGNSNHKTHEVGQKQSNAFGLFDMNGNVWEWCWDWFGGYISNAETDPKGAKIGLDGALRGGSWLSDASYCRGSFRFSNDRDYKYSSNGFRISRTK